MDRPILVTGASGTIGRQVVSGLVSAGHPVRPAGRNVATLAAEFGDAAEPVAFDFIDASTWTAAFAGVDVMFLMRPPALGNFRRDMAPALEAARAAGVRHVVVMSLQGAEHNKILPHTKMEKWARASTLGWTFVRPGFFMENLVTTHVSDIRDRDEIMVPAGDGATSFVAGSDVAAVATAALLDPAAHRGKAWTPTGPQALTYAQVADTLTDVLGRPISYRRPSAARYALHARRTLRMSLGMVAVTSAIYATARLGRAGGLTDDVTTVTGRPALSFREWAAEHAAAWQPHIKESP